MNAVEQGLPGVDITPTLGRGYYPFVDYGRIAAALSICLLHGLTMIYVAQGGYLSPLPPAARDLVFWCMPFFFLVAAFLHGNAGEGARTTRWLATRLERFAPLYMLWAVIYRLFGAPHHFPSIRGLFNDFVLTRYHLWFIPVLLICMTIVWTCARTPQLEARWFRALLALSAAAATACVVGSAFVGVSEYYRTPMF